MRPRTTIVIGICAVVLLCAAAELGVIMHAPQIVHEQGTIEVIMCPECENKFLTLLRGGGDIECALYDYGSTTEQALRAARARVVTDDKDGGSYGKPIEQEGLMHNKFCIVNSSLVVTGSYNPTENGELNRNNMLIILSPTLAKNYAAQFASTESGLMRARITPIVNLSGVRVQNAFCPNDDCEAQVNQVLLGAKREIVYMQFAFTSERLTRTLENAKARGIKVEGICDGGQWNTQGGKCSRLQARSWDLPNMMHHKVFIVDGKTVITGSYNPTNSGTFRNSENILVITDSAIAAEYRLEYEKALIESTIRRK